MLYKEVELFLTSPSKVAALQLFVWRCCRLLVAAWLEYLQAVEDVGGRCKIIATCQKGAVGVDRLGE